MKVSKSFLDFKHSRSKWEGFDIGELAKVHLVVPYVVSWMKRNKTLENSF